MRPFSNVHFSSKFKEDKIFNRRHTGVFRGLKILSDEEIKLKGTLEKSLIINLFFHLKLYRVLLCLQGLTYLLLLIFVRQKNVSVEPLIVLDNL